MKKLLIILFITLSCKSYGQVQFFMLQKESTVAAIDITFSSASTSLTNTAKVFTPSSFNSSFGHEGLDTKKLPSGVTGRIWFKYVATGDADAILGFSTTYALRDYNLMLAGIYVGGAGGNPVGKSQGGAGSNISPGVNGIVGNYYGVYRDGSSGQIRFQTSTDGTTWTDLEISSATSTADLFIVCDLYGASSTKLSFPKGINIKADSVYSYVFIGNSISYGVGASDTAHRWTTLFSSSKGKVEVNMGISGQVLENGTVCSRTVFDETTIPAYISQTALVIALGVNDVGLNNGTMTSSVYQTTLDSIVGYAISAKGWNSTKIILLTPFYITTTGYSSFVGSCSVTTAADTTRHQAYSTAVISVATSRGTQSVDIYTYMKNTSGIDTMISSDGVHPNNTGHALIADYLISIL